MQATHNAATPTPEELVARARTLIPVLRERAKFGDENRYLDPATIQDIEQAGLFRILQPKRYGGYEMDPSVFYDVVMALAEGDMSAGWVFSVVGVHNWQMALLDDRAAQEVWGEDTSVRIASTYMPTGRGKPVDGGFIFSGRWGYSSGCDHCDWVFLGGFVEADEGASLADHRTWLLPRKDFQIVDTWHTVGLKGTGSKDIVVENVFVPEYRTHKLSDAFALDSPGNAVNPSPLYRLPFGQVFGRAISSPGIGALRGMAGAVLETTKERVSVYGVKTKDDPVAQLAIAEALNGADELELIMKRNFAALSEYAQRGETPPYPERLKYRYQASYPAERVMQLATQLYKSIGGAAVFNTRGPHARFMADISVARLHAASTHHMFGNNWARSLLGLDVMDTFV